MRGFGVVFTISRCPAFWAPEEYGKDTHNSSNIHRLLGLFSLFSWDWLNCSFFFANKCFQITVYCNKYSSRRALPILTACIFIGALCPPSPALFLGRNPSLKPPGTGPLSRLAAFFPPGHAQEWLAPADAAFHLPFRTRSANVLNVSRMLPSTSWWHGQACSLTIKYQSSLPIRAKYKHFRTIWEHMWQFSNRSHFFFFELMVANTWSCDFVQLLSRIICKFAISFHTFLRKTFHIKGQRWIWQFFQHLQLTSCIQTWLCNCPQHLCLFDSLVECNTKKHGQGTMLVLSNQRLSEALSTLGQCSASFQASLKPSTYTDKNSPFSQLTNKHFQFGSFAHPFSTRTFSNCFPIVVLL